MTTHPYQGHYMQAAFEGFMRFYASQEGARTAFLETNPSSLSAYFAAHPEATDIVDFGDGMAEGILQEWTDWCVEQFGHPDTLNEDININSDG